MNLVNELLDQVTDRMIYIFFIGLIVGVISSFIGKMLQTYFPLTQVHAVSNATACENHDFCYQQLNRYTPVFKIPKTNRDTSIKNSPSKASYVVVNAQSGAIIFGKNIDLPRPIASLTKLMTAVVTTDLLPPDASIRVSQKATQQIPTKLGIHEGTYMTVDELLPALLMTSANDVAEVLAEEINGVYGSNAFIHAMNTKARLLGLTHTSFDNAQGFDSVNNFSTPRDLAILAQYILTNYPSLSSIMQKSTETLPSTSYHPDIPLYNWNGLLDVYPGIKGLKIGNTPGAGKTAVYASDRGGTEIIVVVLGIDHVDERDLFAAKLFDAGFEKETHAVPVGVTYSLLEQKYRSWPQSLH